MYNPLVTARKKIGFLILAALLFALGYALASFFVLPDFLSKERERHFREEGDLYSIEAVYPVAQRDETQRVIERAVGGEVERFKTIISAIDKEEAKRIQEAGRPYRLVIEYSEHISAGFVSYVFNIYIDTAGAHPNTFFKTLTFFSNGEEVTLEDLFAPGSLYLERLSQLSYPKVLEELRVRTGGVDPQTEEVVREGTAPTAQAFELFYLEGDALHILFPPYQVAAYAAGSFDIAIPLKDLQDILKPEIL